MSIDEIICEKVLNIGHCTYSTDHCKQQLSAFLENLYTTIPVFDQSCIKVHTSDVMWFIDVSDTRITLALINKGIVVLGLVYYRTIYELYYAKDTFTTVKMSSTGKVYSLRLNSDCKIVIYNKKAMKYINGHSWDSILQNINDPFLALLQKDATVCLICDPIPNIVFAAYHIILKSAGCNVKYIGTEQDIVYDDIRMINNVLLQCFIKK